MNIVQKIYAGNTIELTPSNFSIESIGTLIQAVLNALLIIAAIIAFIYLILGGIQWITSGGDKSGMETARNKVTHAVVGLIIVAAAYAIMILVGNFIGLDINELDFGTATEQNQETRRFDNIPVD